MFSPFAILISKAGLPVQSWKRYKLELPNFVNINQQPNIPDCRYIMGRYKSRSPVSPHTLMGASSAVIGLIITATTLGLVARRSINIFPTSHKYTHPRNKNEGGVSFLAIEIFAENVPKFGRQILQKICKSWGHTKVQFLCEMTEHNEKKRGSGESVKTWTFWEQK